MKRAEIFPPSPRPRGESTALCSTRAHPTRYSTTLTRSNNLAPAPRNPHPQVNAGWDPHLRVNPGAMGRPAPFRPSLPGAEGRGEVRGRGRRTRSRSGAPPSFLRFALRVARIPMTGRRGNANPPRPRRCERVAAGKPASIQQPAGRLVDAAAQLGPPSASARTWPAGNNRREAAETQAAAAAAAFSFPTGKGAAVAFLEGSKPLTVARA